MYSPLIGRFLSADSIVPGAGNPQALNRYAYTLGNPLKYTDPSGHDPCTGIPGTYQPDCGVDENESPPKDPIPLTPWGQKMSQFCEGFYGGACNMDNAKDLMARVLTREFTGIVFRKGDPTASARIELLGHATTHSVYMKCEYENGGSPCSELTTNAILNWLGGYSSVAKSMYNGGRVPQAISPLARQVTDSVFNPPDEWTRSAYIDAEPGSWGNASLYYIPRPGGKPGETMSVDDFLEANGYGAPLWRYGLEDQDYFYVLTVAQSRALQPYRVP
jgi:hypothetical protein